MQRKCKLRSQMHTGGWDEVEGGGSINTLVNKNANKTQNKGTPPIFSESLDPLGILAKNIRYPLPWIFNLYASIVKINPKIEFQGNE